MDLVYTNGAFYYSLCSEVCLDVLRENSYYLYDRDDIITQQGFLCHSFKSIELKKLEL